MSTDVQKIQLLQNVAENLNRQIDQKALEDVLRYEDIRDKRDYLFAIIFTPMSLITTLVSLFFIIKMASPVAAFFSSVIAVITMLAGIVTLLSYEKRHGERMIFMVLLRSQLYEEMEVVARTQ